MATPRGRRNRYCTRCGEELENFCFSPDANNLEALRAAALRCQLNGKAEGAVCAKVFIAGRSETALLRHTSPRRVPKSKLKALRSAILRRLRDEGQPS